MGVDERPGPSRLRPGVIFSEDHPVGSRLGCRQGLRYGERMDLSDLNDP